MKLRARALVAVVAVLLAAALAPLRAPAEDATATSLGQDYYNMGRLADAKATLIKALKQNPDDAQALFTLGLVYRDGKNPEKALACFQRAWRSKPGDDGCRTELLRLHRSIAAQFRQEGNQDDAIRELEKLFRQGILATESSAELLTLYDGKRRFEDMLALGRRLDENRTSVVGDDEPWGVIWYYLGLAAKQQQEYGRAEVYLNQAVNCIREHPNARALFEQVRLLQRQRLAPVVERGDGFARDGNFKEALLEYRNALTIDPESRSVKDKIARVSELLEARRLEAVASQFIKDGRWLDAREALTKALEKSPGDEALTQRLARVEESIQKLKVQEDKLAEARTKASQERSDKFRRLLDEAQACFERGDYASAVDNYRKALQMDPQDKVVAESLKVTEAKARLYEEFQSGTRLFGQHNYAESVKRFLSLEKEDPEFRGVRKYLAKNYAAMRQFEQAERYLRLYLEKFPRDTEAYYLLAQVYDQQVDLSETNVRRALLQYEKVRELEPGYEDSEARIRELSWRVHQSKYLLIVLVLGVGFLAWGYTKIRPAREKRSFLAGLERKAARNQWESIKQVHPNMKQHLMSPLEEAQARFIFARAFFETASYSRCVGECQALLGTKRLNQKGRLLMARAYYAQKIVSPETLEYYFELIEAEPDNAELKAYVGRFCAEKKIINPTTLAILKQVALQNPEDDGLRAQLIRGFLREGDRSAAAVALCRVERARNPQNLDVRAILAEDAMNAGRVDEAIRECEEIINLDVNHRRTHAVLLSAYGSLGKLGDLAAIYQSILQNDPHNGVIHGFLQKILHPDGAPDRPPGATAGGEPVDWTSQMPAGFLADKGAAAAQAGDPSAAPADAGGATVVCKTCGAENPRSSYFCSCGNPL